MTALKQFISAYQSRKYIFSCIRNHYVFLELFEETMDLACKVRTFVKFFLDHVEDIADKPFCYRHNPSVYVLDFLYTDIDLMLDVTYEAVKDYVIQDHCKFDLMYEFIFAINGCLYKFDEKYTSEISAAS